MLGKAERLILILSLLTVLCGVLGFKSLNAESSLTIESPSNSAGRGLLVQTYPSGRYAPQYGLYINKTIFLFENDYAFNKVCVNDPTYLWLGIWNAFPKSNLTFASDVLIATPKSGIPYYLITRNWKWQMLNSSYVYHYGFDESKVIVASQEYLDSFPTTYYFGQQF